jgi:hypothetical protein
MDWTRNVLDVPRTKGDEALHPPGPQIAEREAVHASEHAPETPTHEIVGVSPGGTPRYSSGSGMRCKSF